MRGTILGYDAVNHTGVISGFDGNRYDFVRQEWRAEGVPPVGLEVDFQPVEGKATVIYPLQTPASAAPVAAGAASASASASASAATAASVGGAAPFRWGDFLFSYQGRISRSQYWLKFQLPYFLLSLAIGIVESVAQTQGALTALWGLAVLWPSLVVAIKRCHDRDRSGWWLLVFYLVPVIGWIWGLVELGFLRGTIGDNRFGADPVV